ncbi:Protein translocase subunit SecA [Diplonema papillatum]|nr:Protein translocase subunit SecA [Diplonema papillatum]KAJ9462514.1 Protein translocase subunit SecA [Diplonema papillatum]
MGTCGSTAKDNHGSNNKNPRAPTKPPVSGYPPQRRESLKAGRDAAQVVQSAGAAKRRTSLDSGSSAAATGKSAYVRSHTHQPTHTPTDNQLDPENTPPPVSYADIPPSPPREHVSPRRLSVPRPSSLSLTTEQDLLHVLRQPDPVAAHADGTPKDFQSIKTKPRKPPGAVSPAVPYPKSPAFDPPARPPRNLPKRYRRWAPAWTYEEVPHGADYTVRNGLYWVAIPEKKAGLRDFQTRLGRSSSGRSLNVSRIDTGGTLTSKVSTDGTNTSDEPEDRKTPEDEEFALDDDDPLLSKSLTLKTTVSFSKSYRNLAADPSILKKDTFTLPIVPVGSGWVFYYVRENLPVGTDDAMVEKSGFGLWLQTTKEAADPAEEFFEGRTKPAAEVLGVKGLPSNIPRLRKKNFVWVPYKEGVVDVPFHKDTTVTAGVFKDKATGLVWQSYRKDCVPAGELSFSTEPPQDLNASDPHLSATAPVPRASDNGKLADQPEQTRLFTKHPRLHLKSEPTAQGSPGSQASQASSSSFWDNSTHGPSESHRNSWTRESDMLKPPGNLPKVKYSGMFWYPFLILDHVPEGTQYAACTEDEFPVYWANLNRIQAARYNFGKKYPAEYQSFATIDRLNFGMLSERMFPKVLPGEGWVYYGLQAERLPPNVGKEGEGERSWMVLHVTNGVHWVKCAKDAAEPGEPWVAGIVAEAGDAQEAVRQADEQFRQARRKPPSPLRFTSGQQAVPGGGGYPVSVVVNVQRISTGSVWVAHVEQDEVENRFLRFPEINNGDPVFRRGAIRWVAYNLSCAPAGKPKYAGRTQPHAELLGIKTVRQAFLPHPPPDSLGEASVWIPFPSEDHIPPAAELAIVAAFDCNLTETGDLEWIDEDEEALVAEFSSANRKHASPGAKSDSGSGDDGSPPASPTGGLDETIKKWSAQKLADGKRRVLWRLAKGSYGEGFLPSRKSYAEELNVTKIPDSLPKTAKGLFWIPFPANAQLIPEHLRESERVLTNGVFYVLADEVPKPEKGFPATALPDLPRELRARWAYDEEIEQLVRKNRGNGLLVRAVAKAKAQGLGKRDLLQLCHHVLAAGAHNERSEAVEAILKAPQVRGSRQWAQTVIEAMAPDTHRQAKFADSALEAFVKTNTRRFQQPFPNIQRDYTDLQKLLTRKREPAAPDAAAPGITAQQHQASRVSASVYGRKRLIKNVRTTMADAGGGKPALPALPPPGEIATKRGFEKLLWETLAINVSSTSNEKRVRLLYLIFEAVFLVHHFRPTCAQVLAVLCMTDRSSFGSGGGIGEMKTGEGKTITIAMAAAYEVLIRGCQVDVVTSSEILARRDAEKARIFFDFFNISVDHNCHRMNEDSGAPMKNNTEVYKADVVYGTAAEFQFSFIRDVYLNNNERGSRGYHVAIVDEVDNMLIDESGRHARLSSAIAGMDQVHWIYYLIAKRIGEWDEVNRDEVKKQVLEHPSVKNVSPALLTPLIDAHLDSWIKSADRAKTYAKKKEYVVADDQVVNVDCDNTGVIQRSTVLSHGVHQFLQVRERVPVSDESMTGGFCSVLAFFQLYGYKTGLTGTLGEDEEQREFHACYQLGFFQILPNFPVTREEVFDVVVGEAAWLGKIRRAVQKQAVNGDRPVLIISENIQQSETIYAHLQAELFDAAKQPPDAAAPAGKPAGSAAGPPAGQERRRSSLQMHRHALEAQVKKRQDEQTSARRPPAAAAKGGERTAPSGVQSYTGIQADKTEQDILDEAGHPGVVTCSTNLAGRGMDIVTTEASEARGGLYVICSFLPKNSRVELQAAGRTCRQGKKGTFHLITESPVEANIDDLKKHRKTHSQRRAEHKLSVVVPVGKFTADLFSEFCALKNASFDHRDPAKTPNGGRLSESTKRVALSTNLPMHGKYEKRSWREQWMGFMQRFQQDHDGAQTADQAAAFVERQQKYFNSFTKSLTSDLRTGRTIRNPIQLARRASEYILDGRYFLARSDITHALELPTGQHATVYLLQAIVASKLSSSPRDLPSVVRPLEQACALYKKWLSHVETTRLLIPQASRSLVITEVLQEQVKHCELALHDLRAWGNNQEGVDKLKDLIDLEPNGGKVYTSEAAPGTAGNNAVRLKRLGIVGKIVSSFHAAKLKTMRAHLFSRENVVMPSSPERVAAE